MTFKNKNASLDAAQKRLLVLRRENKLARKDPKWKAIMEKKTSRQSLLRAFWRRWLIDEERMGYTAEQRNKYMTAPEEFDTRIAADTARLLGDNSDAGVASAGCTDLFSVLENSI